MRNFTRRRTDKKISGWSKARGIFFTIPTALFLVSCILFSCKGAIFPAQVLTIMTVTSYILDLVGMAISLGFNRSRVFILLLLLMVSQTAFFSSGPAYGEANVYRDMVYFFSSFLLPLNILIFSLLKDRGPFSSQGKQRLGFVFVQLLIVAVVIVSQDKEIIEFIHQELAAQAVWLHTQLPSKVVGLVVFTFGVLILRQISKVSVVDNAFMNLLLLIAVAFHFRGSVTAIPIFYSAAAVMLTVAAIQESYFIAYLDELTSLPARRSLQEEMDRLTGKYTIAMVDVDYFKKINDTYGHDIGDDVLRLIASILQEEICGGKAFRYGGEEFTLLFPGKEGADILPHLEDLREKIAKRPFFLRIKGKSPKKIWVTASIGYGESVGKCSSPDEVIKAADAALYKAKANGRNCVCK